MSQSNNTRNLSLSLSGMVPTKWDPQASPSSFPPSQNHRGPLIALYLSEHAGSFPTPRLPSITSLRMQQMLALRIMLQRRRLRFHKESLTVVNMLGGIIGCWSVSRIAFMPHSHMEARIQTLYCGQSLPLSRLQSSPLITAEGPKSNPAKLPIGSSQTIYELFAQIFCAAIETATDAKPVRYLSR